MNTYVQNQVKQKYYRLYHRTAKAIQTSEFANYTTSKKKALYNRLRRYEARLRRWGIAVASAAALFLSPLSATAQPFIEQTGGSNPFNGVDVGSWSAPAFVDIDNDGDFDAFIGAGDGTIKYYQNTGGGSPAFIEQTGEDNPFNGVDVGNEAVPFLVDIDNDGDFDAFIGAFDGTIRFYLNTGNNNSPAFIEQTGGSNPFNGVDVGYYSSPAFVDIDNDGDFDAFIGEHFGTIKYYRNTGNNSNPTFTEQTGGDNPLDGVDVGNYSSPAFVDIDNDGDFDAFIGELYGTIKYYRNTGNNSNPTFTEQTGGDNPFDGINIGWVPKYNVK